MTGEVFFYVMIDSKLYMLALGFKKPYINSILLENFCNNQLFFIKIKINLYWIYQFKTNNKKLVLNKQLKLTKRIKTNNNKIY